ncbi:MAG TPA: SDR family NAD(P)-dependent oxidoreductase [Dehalococcoidia bacterium]|nr:SDR family NAD(P)-dependent oxidoreductase [Dehalococcoidia bacterium]
MLNWFGRSRRRAEVAGRTVLITEGSKGLGLLLAREFGRLGGRVVIVARDADELELAQQRLRQWGTAAEARICDVRDRAQIEAVVHDVESAYGGIDFLVNNAGVIEVGPLASLTVADFENAMQTMFWGTLVSVFAALGGMKRRRSGKIVNITSVGGKVSVPHLLPYSSAKFAAVGFSEGLRAELAGTGVGVVTVVPGLMRTGSFLNALFKGRTRFEFGWFSLGASLPLISADAERAAKRIVRAAIDDEPEVIITSLANFGVRFHGIAPGITTLLFSLVARLMPSGQVGVASAVPGREVMPEVSAISPALALGIRAAREIQPPSSNSGGDSAAEPSSVGHTAPGNSGDRP